MMVSDSLRVLESSALVAPVTALEFLGDDYLLTGDGPVLSVFSLQASLGQCASVTVLHNYRIHGIRPKVQFNDCDTTICEMVKVVIFGGKGVRLISFRPSGLDLEVAGPLLELQDWVLDVSWLSAETCPLLGICLAHNAVLLLEPESGNILSLDCCVEACLLYSALLVGPVWETSVLVGGTVFNQLVLWRPKGSGSAGRSQVERRLLGHSGVIFSLCYLKSSGWLASASDDRSVRVWHIGSLGDGGCGEESPTCLRVLYGHQARVFCVRLSSSCVFSAGEDGACLVWQWTGEGKVRQTLKGHRSGGIRALAVSRGGGWVATGGADGGIRLWSVSEDEGEQEKERKDSESQIDLGFSGQGCPKVVRTVGGLHDVLVCTDQGEVFLYQEGLWNTIWNGGPEFQSYCVMEVASIRSQDSRSDEWVCAVGNLNGGVQVFAIRLPSSGIFLQAGEGKIQSLHWVEGCNGMILLASALDGLVYRWEVEVRQHDDESGLIMHLENLKPFQLPPCSKRWLTAAVTVPCDKGSLWVCGDRRGSLLLYKDMEKSVMGEDGKKNKEEAWENEIGLPESSDVSSPLCPVTTLFGIHGKQGVTSVSKYQSVCYSTGRDGCVRVLTVSGNSLNVRRVHRVSKGMEWLEKVFFLGSGVAENQKSRIEGSKEEDNSIPEEALYSELGSEERKEESEIEDESVSEAHFVMAGFHSVQFVLWDPLRQVKLLSVPCGGGHRSWTYVSTMESQPSLHTIGKGTLIFIKQGSVMASRCLTFSTTEVTEHTLKEGLQGRGQSCVCHLGSISKGGESSSIWEVLVTGGEDTTVTVLGIESKHGTVKVLSVIADHISNVRTVAAVRTETKQDGNKEAETFSTLLFSAGGRAQLQCYRLRIGWLDQMNKPVCQVEQIAGHRLDEQWERRRNRHKTVKMDPETRYMSMAVVHDRRTEILLALACSDGAVRLFRVQEESSTIELLWESFYHQRCVLTVASCNLEDAQFSRHELLFSGATDGAIALWNLTTVLDNKSRDSWHGPSAPCFSTPVHQSGVNTLVILKDAESGQMNKGVLTVASGGDDGQLSVIKIRVQFREGVVFTELLSHHSVQSAHAAPLTALSDLNPDFLVSSSPDQRVCVWHVCGDGIHHQSTMFSHTADAAGLSAWHSEGSEGETYVVVCGQGLQMLKLREQGEK